MEGPETAHTAGCRRNRMKEEFAEKVERSGSESMEVRGSEPISSGTT